MEKRSREQIYRINQLIQEYNNERKEFNNWQTYMKKVYGIILFMK